MSTNQDIDQTPETGKPERGRTQPLGSEPNFSIEPPDYYQPRSNRRILVLAGAGLFIIIGTLGYLSWRYFGLSPAEQGVQTATASVITQTATPTLTPTLAPTLTPAEAANPLSIRAPTITPTPVPGGNIIIVAPNREDTGWVVSEDETIVSIYDQQNHFGDSYLYAGILGGKIYHGAFQFDLSFIPRGTKIHAATLRLNGLRIDLLDEVGSGTWQLHLLAPGLDEFWRNTNYHQIHQALPRITFQSAINQEQLGPGEENLFTFTPEQLDLLERRLLDGSGRISFRLDGPIEGNDNLFAWDTGFGPATRGQGPELFLSLGPPPETTPVPDYVVITETPTPENIITAAAISLQLTAEATRIGTATPLPPNWVTPIVVTATPTGQNEATAQVMNQRATAVALTTGEAANIVTATPTPTFVVVTSTPTPENVATLAQVAIRLTADATRVGTATPLPPNWVTPVVVTETPTPENAATALFRQLEVTAQAIAYGTSTPTPPNVTTATPTPTYLVITSTPTPETIETAIVISLRQTAEAAQNGTATPLPGNWVTPVVVTATPTPNNAATAEYWQAVLITTGTPTPTPFNVQTATPTGIFTPVGPFVSPTPTDTPTPIPPPMPDVLLGKIAFLSDREGATEEERRRAGLLRVTPQAQPQVYIYDPETDQIGRLADVWPYQVAVQRDSWSADRRFRVFTKDAIRYREGGSFRPFIREDVPAIYWYDAYYQIEEQLSLFGAGIAYEGVWSPTAEEVAFVANESGNDEIWSATRDGSGTRQLTRNEWEWDKHPSWSPDGQQVVFFSNRTGANQIWIMNKDGSGQRLLMESNPYNDWNPVWIKYPDAAPP